jgi:hypothetical protein
VFNEYILIKKYTVNTMLSKMNIEYSFVDQHFALNKETDTKQTDGLSNVMISAD